MVAYSFQKEFSPLIVDGLKRQTVRGHRRRHARPGEMIQLFSGMRTRHCRKIIPDPVCTGIFDLRFDLTALADASEPMTAEEVEALSLLPRLYFNGGEIETAFGKQFFAASDGFIDRVFRGASVRLSPLAAMVSFWMHRHGPVDFRGVVIRWEDAA